MRFIRLALTFCLLATTLTVSSVRALDDSEASAAISQVPGHVFGSTFVKLTKDISAKDIIVNVGKVKVDIDINNKGRDGHGGGYDGGHDGGHDGGYDGGHGHDGGHDGAVVVKDGGDDGHDGSPSVKIIKDLDVDAKDIIINIGKVKIDVDINKKRKDGHDGGHDGGYDGKDGGHDGGHDGGYDGGKDGGKDGGYDGGHDGGHDGGYDAAKKP